MEESRLFGSLIKFPSYSSFPRLLPDSSWCCSNPSVLVTNVGSMSSRIRLLEHSVLGSGFLPQHSLTTSTLQRWEHACWRSLTLSPWILSKVCDTFCCFQSLRNNANCILDGIKNDALIYLISGSSVIATMSTSPNPYFRQAWDLAVENDRFYRGGVSIDQRCSMSWENISIVHSPTCQRSW